MTPTSGHTRGGQWEEDLRVEEVAPTVAVDVRQIAASEIYVVVFVGSNALGCDFSSGDAA